jgi:LssY C-terminus
MDNPPILFSWLWPPIAAILYVNFSTFQFGGLISLFPRLAVVTLFVSLVPGLAEACAELPRGATFRIRLQDAISSYDARRGMEVRGVMHESPVCESGAVFATGIPVEGKVTSVHKVGLGLRHETASLELEFHRIAVPDVTVVSIHARVSDVDNAKEKVKDGVIRGVRSTGSPQGRINSRLKHLPAINPYSDWTLIVFKSVFPVFPEPEIYLRAGTELSLKLADSVAIPAGLVMPSPMRSMTPEQSAGIAAELVALPPRTSTAKAVEADVVNLVFASARQRLEAAFAAAGWKVSERISTRVFLRQFYAFLQLKSYSTAPMSAQYLQGKLPDVTWQKSLDSYEKRDHVRVWQLDASSEGEPLWAAAATKENSAALSFRRRKFIHHVNARIDEERSTILRDLTAAGCVAEVSRIPRPNLSRRMVNATGDLMLTDGDVVVVRLQDCRLAPWRDQAVTHPGSKLYRYARKQILTFRSDIWRANIIYGAYDATRMVIGALCRQQPSARILLDPP